MIFEHAKESVGKDFIFVDNNPRNVKVIRELGVKVFLFRGFQRLTYFLGKLL